MSVPDDITISLRLDPRHERSQQCADGDAQHGDHGNANSTDEVAKEIVTLLDRRREHELIHPRGEVAICCCRHKASGHQQTDQRDSHIELLNDDGSVLVHATHAPSHLNLIGARGAEDE